jgi:hypothetical protein
MLKNYHVIICLTLDSNSVIYYTCLFFKNGFLLKPVLSSYEHTKRLRKTLLMIFCMFMNLLIEEK